MIRKFFLALGFLSTASSASVHPDLIGGRVVTSAEFPEVVRVRNQNASCSAALVGPKVLLTAAHCTSPNGTLTFNVHNVSARYTARCTQSPDYRTGDHDMALCLVDRPTSVRFASMVNTVPRVGEWVTLTGYGCTTGNPNPSGGNNGVLKAGNIQVATLPGGTSHNYWFETMGNVATCFGDSGSPVFLKVSPNSGIHEVVGVVSRGDAVRRSLLTATGLQLSREFAEEFANTHHVSICGITKAC